MRNDQPFDQSGVARDPRGSAYYRDRPVSLVHMLRATVERVPRAEALKEVGGRSVTYRELWDEAARIAGGLAAAGIASGDRVALRLPNGVDWAVAFLATQLAGTVAVPVNPALTPAEADYVLTDSGARFCFEPGTTLPAASPLAVEHLVPDDLAAIFYTSGTTGTPKGAMITHRNFLTNTETVRRVLGLGPDDEPLRNLAATPLLTVTSSNSQLLPMCELGGTTVVLPRFTPDAFVHAIEDERVHLVLGSPGMFRLAFSRPDFAAIDTASVRRAIYGAAPASSDFVDYLARSVPSASIEAAYGLTEVSSVATYLPSGWARTYPASVGFAAPVVDLDLLDVDPDTGVGELRIRGGNVAAGYWRRPEATAEAFVDGWLHTGDLARIDELGLLYIVDRKKDMINRGGANVYSVEVENALARHPGVLEVAVVGVADEVLGERVGAVLVPVPGVELDPVEVLSEARERLAGYKRPQWVSVRTTPLPRNPGGKIVKPVLRETTVWQRVDPHH